VSPGWSGIGGDYRREQGLSRGCLRGLPGAGGSFRRPPAGYMRDRALSYLATRGMFAVYAYQAKRGRSLESTGRPPSFHALRSATGRSSVGCEDFVWRLACPLVASSHAARRASLLLDALSRPTERLVAPRPAEEAVAATLAAEHVVVRTTADEVAAAQAAYNVDAASAAITSRRLVPRIRARAGVPKIVAGTPRRAGRERP